MGYSGFPPIFAGSSAFLYPRIPQWTCIHYRISSLFLGRILGTSVMSWMSHTQQNKRTAGLRNAGDIIQC